jgi:hypothetical protein
MKYAIQSATGVSEVKGMSAMATFETEEEILTFDVSDEALEIAGIDRTNFTLHLGSAGVLPVHRRMT